MFELIRTYRRAEFHINDLRIYLPKAGNVATIKKSWKKVGGQAVSGGSCHKSKRSIVGPNGKGGPPPPKQMADLLK